MADAFFGVDNTFLTRALDDGLFEPYTAKGLAAVPREVPARPAAPRHADRQRRRVRQRRPRVVRPQRPSAGAEVARRSHQARVPQAARGREPGHVVARARVPAHDDRRRSATAAGTTTGSRCAPTACGSTTVGTQAYDTDFTAGGRERRPPARRVVRDRPRGRRRVLERQEDDADGRRRARHVLRAGRVRGRAARARRTRRARRRSSTSCSPRTFQEDVPLQMYVYPVVPGTKLPPVFTKFAPQPHGVLARRRRRSARTATTWIDQWTQIVLQ